MLFKMSSAICFNFDQSKIFPSGNGLRLKKHKPINKSLCLFHQESCTLELHQSFGQDYSTLAACQLTFKDIFDKTHGRIHGTAVLTGVSGSGSGAGFGSVEYWIRLRVPIDHALRLYKVNPQHLILSFSRHSVITFF